MFIDSHAHLFMIIKEKGIPLSDLICKMKENSISTVVNVCGTIEELEFSEFLKNEFQKAHIKFFSIAGIHPHESSEFMDSDISWISDNSDRIIGIGEVGLDFFYDLSPRDSQEKMFRKMVELSIELKKPLIIHGRNAEDRVLDILEEYPSFPEKVLFHCYTGSLWTVSRILKKGYYISYSGILTFKKNEDTSKAFDSTKTDKILFETDSPFLAPVPFRGSVNTPSMVKYVYEYAGARKNIEIQQLALQIKNNFNRFFNIEI